MRIFVRGGINSYVGNLPFYLQQFWGYENDMQNQIVEYQNKIYEDNELALGLCKREKELLEVFAVRKWQLPSLKNVELDKCLNVLRNRAAARLL